jgi:hypothetical protein
MTITIPVSWFSSRYDTRPRNVTINLGTQPGAFVREAPTERREKYTLPMWSPATFTGDRRLKSEVASVSALVIDVDEGAGNIAAFTASLAAAVPVHWTVHSSFSATPECWKWRAIATVSQPMTPAEHMQVWRAVRHLLARKSGISIDKACTDPSRAYFIPWVPPSGRYVTGEVPGEPLDVAAFAAFAEKLARPAVRVVRVAHATITNVFARAQAYVRGFPGAVAGQHGHAHTFNLAQRLVRGLQLSKQDSMDLLLEWNSTCSPPWHLRDLERKVDQAAEFGTMEPGCMLGQRGAE